MWPQRSGCEGEVGADPWDSGGRRLTLAGRTHFEGMGGSIQEEVSVFLGGVQSQGQLRGAAPALLPRCPTPGLALHLWVSEPRTSKARGGSQCTPTALSTEVPCFPTPGPSCPPAHSSQQEVFGAASPGDPPAPTTQISPWPHSGPVPCPGHPQAASGPEFMGVTGRERRPF